MKQWYYAKNNQKFGPFQKSRMLELYQKGEIAPGDLVWEEGSADWVTAEKAFGSLMVNADTASPAPVQVRREFDPIDCIKRAWDLIWQQPAYLIGGSLLAMVMASVTQIPMQIGAELFNLAPTQGWQSPLVISGIALYVLGFILSFIINPLVYGGLFWMVLQIVRGNQPNFADLFVAFRNFNLALKLILANILIAILTLLGLIVLIIPGIYLMIAYTFVNILLIDRKLGVWEAMELSRQVVTRKWWSVFALMLLGFGIIILGFLACCVGTLIAIPLLYAAMMYAYETLFNNEK